MRAFDDHSSNVDALLARFDELPPDELARLERDPRQAPRLRRLRGADAWLAAQLEALEACPTPDELYVYGRGPGYGEPLGAEAQAELDDHVTRCAACRAAAASLGVAPPPPLDLSHHDEVEAPAPTPPHPSRPTARAPRLRLLGPARIAAAAALLFAAGALLWTRRPSTAFPELPVLRGLESTALAFPRGKLLAGADAALPTFHVAPVAGASAYRVVLRRHGGSAFDDGSVLEELTAPGAQLVGDLELGPGHYTWEAWAVVDGLDQRLGARDFRVVADEPLRTRLRELEPLERVRELHAEGFYTDAHSVAEGLPAGSARDAYLKGLEER